MRTRAALVSGVAALVLLLCVSASTAEEEKPKIECNENCQKIRNISLANFKEMEECRKMGRSSQEQGRSWFRKECNATVDLGIVEAMVCWNRLIGIFTRDYKVNKTWWNDHTQRQADACAAYHLMVKEGEREKNVHLEQFCNFTDTIREGRNKCLCDAKDAEKDDKGVAAMRVLLRCYCELHVKLWENNKKMWGKRKWKGKNAGANHTSTEASEQKQ